MSKEADRLISALILSLGAIALVVGALSLRADATTGAESNYAMTVSWSGAVRSALWPPSISASLPLFGVGGLVVATWLCVFRLPPLYGATVLAIEAVAIYARTGWIGFFLIGRELTAYHFRMDAERLGEHWFWFEAASIWILVLGALAALRLLHWRHMGNGGPVRTTGVI